MPELAQILDAQHEIWVTNHEWWAAEERRLHGGYPMLVELERFTNETDLSYRSRQQQSPLLNFGRIHGSIVIGHLNEVAPIPNYGTLGQVRERKAIPRGQETPAERFHFNSNGVGTNGIPFTALSSGIQLRSLATGYRVTMVEMPRRKNPDAPIRGTDIAAGFRPFIVEYSPRAMPMWEMTDGRFDWAVLRTQWRKPGLWEPSSGEQGYYLLVRQGYDGLGDQFAGGGWWLFDPHKKLEDKGTWQRTKGEIPLALYGVDESEGTDDSPAMSTMPLMELNQLSSGLMNRISERNWNARQAAKSVKHVLGAEPRTFNEAMEVSKSGSLYVPWQAYIGPHGDILIPTIYDGANGAVESSVYAEIIRSTIEEAHEIMVRNLTSVPESSGISKEAGFNEGTSPLLSSLATRRESWENTVIPWVEMRAGAEQPSGFVEWPTEFDLTPIIQKIDRAFDRMFKIGARSPTLETAMLEKAAMEEGVWPTKAADATLARDELEASLRAIRPDQADSVAKLTASGAAIEGAASGVGLTDDQVTELAGGDVTGSPDQMLPEAAAVTAGPIEEGADGQPPAIAAQRGPSPRTAEQSLNVSGSPSSGPPAGPPAARRFQSCDNLERSAPNDRPVIAPGAPSPAPEVDLTPVTDRLDALTQQIAALVTAISAQKAPEPPPPAPVILPIMMPQPATGKTVTVTTPEKRTFIVTSETNGTQP